ncbi:MAG: response regulator [Vulcanimicrobiota bacterium]
MNVLLIEDSPTDAELLEFKLSQRGNGEINLEWVSRLADGLARLEEEGFDLVLLDLSLPDAQGLGTFQRLNQNASASRLPIVVLTGLADSQLAIDTVREGAQDYLVKDEVDGRILLRSLHYAIERKKVQLEALRLRHEAEQMERRRSEFLAMVSHELRNPMTGILGYGHLLSKTQLDLLQREYVEAICGGAQSLVALLNNLLELSSAEAGQVRLESQPVDLREVLEETVALQLAQVRQKGLELVCTIDPAIPDRVTSDPLKVRQVLLNLLTNATKFTERGYLGVSARVRAQANQSVVVRFVVEDSGRGIPPEKKKTVFQPFSQTESSDREVGSGLGLAICQKVVQAMGGVLGVESQLGSGTAFWFDLPFNVVTPSSLNDRLRGRRVLVADHDRQVSSAHAFMLRELGAEVLRVGDAALLLKEATNQTFDALLISSEFDAGRGGQLASQLSPRIPQRLVSDYEKRGQLPCGATFVSRPLRLADLCRPETVGAPAPERGGRLLEGKILVVDDDPICGRLVEAIASSLGLESRLAATGARARELADRHDFQLILLDFRLPDIDGLQLAQQLRSRQPKALIVAVSGLSSPTAAQLEEAGLDRFLAKPVAPVLLEELIRQAFTPVSAIDWATLASLKKYERGQNSNLIRDLIEAFLNTSVERSQALRTSLENDDRESLRRVAHQLKGAAASVGAALVAERSDRLENLDDPEALARVTNSLLDALDQSLTELRQYLQERAADVRET